MDYEAFWRGFVVMFAIIPAAIGAGAGITWALRRKLSPIQTVLATTVGGLGLPLVTLAAAVLFFRA